MAAPVPVGVDPDRAADDRSEPRMRRRTACCSPVSRGHPMQGHYRRTLERVRLDKWLWAARFYKTRSAATDAVNGGLVQVGGRAGEAGARGAAGRRRRGSDRPRPPHGDRPRPRRAPRPGERRRDPLRGDAGVRCGARGSSRCSAASPLRSAPISAPGRRNWPADGSRRFGRPSGRTNCKRARRNPRPPPNDPDAGTGCGCAPPTPPALHRWAARVRPPSSGRPSPFFRAKAVAGFGSLSRGARI